MPDTLEEFLMQRPPTAERPLLGQIVLVVEDSRFACEALRLICQKSGARIRRADTLRAAERHLMTYRPTIALVDLGLPDGSGLELIARLARSEPRVQVILGMSGDDSLAEAATEAGADAFIAKPINSVGAFQAAILALLPDEARPTGLRIVNADHVIPDRIALRDDLSHAADLLTGEQDATTLGYLGLFLGGLAKSADDDVLADAASKLTQGVAEGDLPPDAAIAHVTALVRDRIASEGAV